MSNYKGMCHRCFNSNSSINIINGIPVCLKCNRVKDGRNSIRLCIGCKAEIDFKESGMGTKVRCDSCQKERRRIMQNENNRKNYRLHTND